ncbi:MAG: hypothetical protein ACETWM_03190 [Candidatus Lokiarchaeia archaeon]
MLTVTINLDDKTVGFLKDFSKSSKVGLEKLCELILDTFVDFGGRLFLGDYREGVRVVIDWPSKLHFAILKVRKEEMIESKEG